MSDYRFQALARLDGMTEGRIGGGSLELVTVCLSDEWTGELCDEHGRPLAPAPEVVTHLRPNDARRLAFCLLGLAELAERRSEDEHERA
jgi:hypothetical protein